MADEPPTKERLKREAALAAVELGRKLGRGVGVTVIVRGAAGFHCATTDPEQLIPALKEFIRRNEH